MGFVLLMLMAWFPAAAQETLLNGFDDYVNHSLRDWEVSGLAIATASRKRWISKDWITRGGCSTSPKGLIRRKYSNQNIELVLGGNFQRVLAQSWTV